MKKILAIILAAAMLLSLFSIAALAAEAPSEGGIYDVTVAEGYAATATVTPLDETGAEVAKTSAEIDDAAVDFYANAVQLKIELTGVTVGNYYLVLAQNDDKTPNVENIVYIDQITATETTDATETTVTFRVFPNKLDSGVTYHVYLSSTENAREKLVSFKSYVAYTRGDVNVDGFVTLQDAIMVLKKIANNLDPDLTPNQELAADADENGSIGVIDVLFILQYIAGKRDQDTWKPIEP